jgi:DNA polymerase III sliding clamp (beta) subunit (PCNA family)
MNFLISSTKLANAARIAALAIRPDQRRRSPILGCCRLTAGNNLSIAGTDLDTGITAVADCDVIEPGEAAVDAQRLADIASKLKGDVRIEAKAGELVIKCGRSRFALTMQPAEDYPAPLTVDDAPPIELTAADVMAAFAGAAAGAAQDDKRIYLAGPVLFSEPTDMSHRLVGVGADGIALSYAATSAFYPGLDPGIVVHRDTCKLAVRLFGETGAALRVGKDLMELASDSIRLVAKLVDSTPTAWRSMVPPIDAANSALVATKDLNAALERCFAVINNLTGDLAKRVPSITIWWDAAAGPLHGQEVRVAFRNINEAPAVLDIVPAAELSGAVDININPKLLQRLLAEMESETVRLSASGHPSDTLRIDAGPDRFAVLGAMRELSFIDAEAA